MTNLEKIEDAKKYNPLLKDMPVKTYNNDLTECFKYFDRLMEEKKIEEKKALSINESNKNTK